MKAKGLSTGWKQRTVIICCANANRAFSRIAEVTKCTVSVFWVERAFGKNFLESRPCFTSCRKLHITCSLKRVLSFGTSHVCLLISFVRCFRNANASLSILPARKLCVSYHCTKGIHLWQFIKLHGQNIVPWPSSLQLTFWLFCSKTNTWGQEISFREPLAQLFLYGKADAIDKKYVVQNRHGYKLQTGVEILSSLGLTLAMNCGHSSSISRVHGNW